MHVEHLRKVTAEFRKELEQCASKPEEEPVHRLRTGTRRVQAMIETILRESSGPEVEEAGKAWLKDLKKIRRAAGPVRDLDVHRGLLDKLLESERKSGRPQALDDTQATGETGVIEQPEELLPPSFFEQQVEHLDAWLKHAREHQADGLRKVAAKFLKKLDVREQEFKAAMAGHARRQRTQPAHIVALDVFAHLSEEIPVLDPANLHDFRKGAKNARYIAESAADDATAEAIAKTLKKLQDDIGDWHDWLVLSEEAHTALKDAPELFATLDAKVARLYAAALKTSARLRGRLMGEWQAIHSQQPKRRTAPRTAPRTASRARASSPAKSNSHAPQDQSSNPV